VLLCLRDRGAEKRQQLADACVITGAELEYALEALARLALVRLHDDGEVVILTKAGYHAAFALGTPADAE
jgi:hypothetical protein